MKKSLSLYSILLYAFLLLNIIGLVNASGDDDNENSSTVFVLFMFFGIGLGIIIMQILSYFGEVIPYTCVVFITGMIFALLNENNAGTLGESIQDWANFDAELLLFVFLPPLIFGEAMSLNWYHVKGGFIQALLLAGPGVLFGAILMGVITKFILPYNWSWNLAMVFGSILSATDPVAVVALLKSAGASPKLTILIVGESLMNDGTAMVLFTLFYNALNGTKYSIGDITAFFFSAAIGSVLLGIAFGLATVRWLRSANRPLKEIDISVQIAITICCAYLVFFTAQYVLEISGILACCGAGLMLAWLAPPIILSHETMHNVWGMIEWLMNTMIFLLAGLIIGNSVISQLDVSDWFYALMFYAILMAIRFVTVALLFPFLSKIGHKLSFKESIFLSWGGLRGALGMALALIVKSNGPDDISEDTSRLFFYVGSIAALTLVVNATTANFVLESLGLLGTDSAQKALVMNQVRKKLRKKMDKLVEQMSKEFKFTDSDLDEVRMSCTLLNNYDVNIDTILRDTERMSTLLANSNGSQKEDSQNEEVVNAMFDSQQRRRSSGAMGITTNSFGNNGITKSRRNSKTVRAMNEDRFHTALHSHSKGDRLSSQGLGQPMTLDELIACIRAVFMEIVRVKYWQFIEGGNLPRLSYSAQFLLYSIEVGLDEVDLDQGAPDWNCIREELERTPNIVKVLNLWQNYMPPFMTKLSSKILGRIESKTEKRTVYILTSFIEAHEHAQRKIHNFISLEESEDHRTIEELKVINESREAVEEAKKLLEAMDRDTVSAIRSKQAARLVLSKQAEMVKNMLHEGILTAQHAEEFLEEISHDTERIETERNRMYRLHEIAKAKQKQALKREEQAERDTITNRSSLFSIFENIGSPKVDRSSQSNILESP